MHTFNTSSLSSTFSTADEEYQTMKGVQTMVRVEFKWVEGFQEERPLAIDLTSSKCGVYLRQNFKIVNNEDSSGQHWKYQEAFLTLELNYITIETLRGRVELGKRKPSKGITEEEFFEITGEVY